jgi:hypothetical protein
MYFISKLTSILALFILILSPKVTQSSPLLKRTPPPHACAGQFQGPEGCLNQHLRISDVQFSPNGDYIRWTGLNQNIERGFWNSPDGTSWDFGQPGADDAFLIRTHGPSLYMGYSSLTNSVISTGLAECTDLAWINCWWKFTGGNINVVEGFTQIILREGGPRCLTIPSVTGDNRPLSVQNCLTPFDPSQLFFLDAALVE